MKNFFLAVFDLLKIVIIALLILLPIRYFIFQPFFVKGASMEPNFYDREYLIVDELSYRFNDPVRGDIIVFRYPRNPQDFYIKRIIGLPGETVQIKDGKIYIFNDENPDGFALEEGYLENEIKTVNLNNDTNEVELKDGEFFVLGDNRHQSRDSRIFGPVDESFIIGKVMFRGWPINRVQFFEAPQYSN